jgi:hypothetical protein
MVASYITPILFSIDIFCLWKEEQIFEEESLLGNE